VLLGELRRGGNKKTERKLGIRMKKKTKGITKGGGKRKRGGGPNVHLNGGTQMDSWKG